jgi:hypothetical protein
LVPPIKAMEKYTTFCYYLKKQSITISRLFLILKRTPKKAQKCTRPPKNVKKH